LKRVRAISKIRPHSPVIVKGKVIAAPTLVPKRHRIFSIEDETGKVDCAAYEPTVMLCKTARKLMTGDILKVCGGVQSAFSGYQFTINLEKMKVLELAPKTSFINPSCPECGKRMKSMGKNQGFRCKKCGFRSSQLKKLEVNEERWLERILYITSPRSQRHLTKPHRRYGIEKTGAPKTMIENWHHP